MSKFEKIIITWVLTLITLFLGAITYVWISDLKRIEDIIVETDADLGDILDCLRERRLITD